MNLLWNFSTSLWKYLQYWPVSTCSFMSADVFFPSSKTHLVIIEMWNLLTDFPVSYNGLKMLFLAPLWEKWLVVYAQSPDSARRIPASGSSYKKHWWGTPHKLMDRNTARCLEEQITNYASKRQLKITQKSSALVSLRWRKQAETQLIQLGYNDFTLPQDLILHLYVNLCNHNLITAYVSCIPLHLIVL